MKVLLVLTICASTAFSFPGTLEAESCSAAKCKIEDGCRCASERSPLGDTLKTPQFVTITFDDSLQESTVNYVRKLLFKRKNPDGSPVTATFYLPHKYTNYERANDLYNRGFEVGVHSVTKNTAEYFQKASVEVLLAEFGGQRDIIHTYTGIPKEDIIGARTPHLAINGDNTIEAYIKSGIKYDNSWVMRSNQPLFPFTLDYKAQPSQVATSPTGSFPGFWVLPIISFVRQDGYECNMLHGCQLQGSTAKLLDWLIEQFERTHSNNRAPLTLAVSEAWFGGTENSFEAFEQFLEYLGKQNETYLVSHSEVLRWSKNPVPLGQYKAKFEERDVDCFKTTCELPHEGENLRMVICTECPDEYPWIKV